MHDAPAVAENEKQVSIRLPTSAVARAKRLAGVLSKRLAGSGMKPATVLRMALLRGLDVLEQEHGIAGEVPASDEEGGDE